MSDTGDQQASEHHHSHNPEEFFERDIEIERESLHDSVAHDYSTSDTGLVPLDKRRPIGHFIALWTTFAAGFSFLFVGTEVHDSVRANSRVTVDEPDSIAGKRVLVIEDGPTLTHGDMKYGAGVVAARQHGAAEIVDPRPWAVGTIDETFRKYDVGPVLPAMGYSEGQLAEMEKIIDAADVDLVVIGTPIDLRRVITISKPAVRVRYDLDVLPDSPTLTDVLAPVLKG